MRSFKDLDVWKNSIIFSTKIYEITKTFPKEEVYGLTSQLRRASVSIPSNIAEGSKKSKKDFLNFIKIAQGSGAEVETQLIIASHLGYISEKDFQSTLSELESIMKMLTNLFKGISAFEPE
jgi:four helix bundle protein